MLAGTSTALTIAAHVAGGGGMPDLGLTLVPTLLIAGGGVFLLDRRPSRSTILAVLASSQAAMHTLMALSDHDGAMTWRMLAGHALATVLLATVLGHADAVLRTLHAVANLLIPAVPPALPARSVPAVLVEVVGTDVVSSMFARTRPWRGPPRCS